MLEIQSCLLVDVGVGVGVENGFVGVKAPDLSYFENRTQDTNTWQDTGHRTQDTRQDIGHSSYP